MKTTKLLLVMIFSLVVAACGSGGGSSSLATTELSGVASKGLISNATITAFQIDPKNGQKGGVIGKPVTSSPTGTYKIDLGSYSGAVLIEVTGGTYTDEATGNTVVLTSTMRAAIANVLPNKDGTKSINSASVTPITEAAVQNALANPNGLGLTPVNIQTANDIVKSYVGFDPVSTQPADATNPASATASTANKIYAALLGAVSQYLKDNPLSTLSSAITDFASALKAGGGGLAGNPLITAAVNNFGTNTNNKTGVPSMGVMQSLTSTLATIDDENPASQRSIAAAFFKDDSSISSCVDNSVPTCNVWYNYNLSGMPGCFSAGSNYIGHYQNNNNGWDTEGWKKNGFICSKSNQYASDVWSMNDGRVMNGTHNGIDILHKSTQIIHILRFTPLHQEWLLMKAQEHSRLLPFMMSRKS